MVATQHARRLPRRKTATAAAAAGGCQPSRVANHRGSRAGAVVRLPVMPTIVDSRLSAASHVYHNHNIYTESTERPDESPPRVLRRLMVGRRPVPLWQRLHGRNPAPAARLLSSPPLMPPRRPSWTSPASPTRRPSLCGRPATAAMRSSRLRRRTLPSAFVPWTDPLQLSQQVALSDG